MGYGHDQTVQIHVTLDEHAGEKEARHDALWHELKCRATAALFELISDPKYAELNPEIY